MFDFAIKWGYNVEKYWFCREKQWIGRMWTTMSEMNGEKDMRGNSDLHKLYGGGKASVKKHNAFLSEGSLKMADYLEENGITECGKVTKTALNSYLLFQGKEGKAASTISRFLASAKSFFGWMFRKERSGEIRRIRSMRPKIEKKVPVILTVDEVTKLLEQPSCANPKEIRDKAMLELFTRQGSV